MKKESVCGLAQRCHGNRLTLITVNSHCLEINLIKNSSFCVILHEQRCSRTPVFHRVGVDET